MRTHRGVPCPDLDGYPCPACDRAISAAESERYAPTGYADGESDQEADRYEREVLGL